MSVSLFKAIVLRSDLGDDHFQLTRGQPFFVKLPRFALLSLSPCAVSAWGNGQMQKSLNSKLVSSCTTSRGRITPSRTLFYHVRVSTKATS